MSHGCTEKSFDFLEGLETHNDRDRFDTNRDTFSAYLETPFANLPGTPTNCLSDTRQPLSGGRDTMRLLGFARPWLLG